MKEEHIQLAHGSGGKLSRDLVNTVMLPAFANPILSEMHDGAKLDINGAKLAFTTDSFVVKPLFFNGGDIGKLAVCGTVNDLAMTGARPLYLSVGLIIEEGFGIDELKRIVSSMKAAANEAGVHIVTGDTKVVEKGAVDGIYINTAGVGAVMTGVDISASKVRPGQDIILSGCLGDHSLAVMSERHGLVLPESVRSDCAPLNGMVEQVLASVPQIAVLRDPTRGGLATALNEIAAAAGVGVLLNETAIPVRAEVKAACDILGYDPLYMANEGKMIAIVDSRYTATVLEIMRSHHYGKEACIIGRTVDKPAGQVGIATAIGGVRLLDMLVGDQLPRIC